MRATRPQNSQNLADFIVLRSSKWAYFRWLVGLLASFIYTYFFFGLEQISPGQTPIQLAFAFMCGLDVILLLNLVNSYYRRIFIDNLGMSTRFLFKPDEIIPYENIKIVEWWRGGGKTIKYLIHQKIGQIEIALDTTTWENTHAAIRFLQIYGNIPSVRSGLQPGRTFLKRSVSILLMALGISMTMFGVFLMDAIGFVIIRFFWTHFLYDQKPHDVRAIRVYLTFFALATLAGLFVIAGQNSLKIAAWWIYSPAIDIVIAYLLEKRSVRKLTA